MSTEMMVKAALKRAATILGHMLVHAGDHLVTVVLFQCHHV